MVELDPKVHRVVIVFWMLNEMFTKEKVLVRENASQIPTLAKDLAFAMSRFDYRIAVVGGSSQLWNTDPVFDEYVETACAVLYEHKVYNTTGAVFSSQLDKYDA